MPIVVEIVFFQELFALLPSLLKTLNRAATSFHYEHCSANGSVKPDVWIEPAWWLLWKTHFHWIFLSLLVNSVRHPHHSKVANERTKSLSVGKGEGK